MEELKKRRSDYGVPRLDIKGQVFNKLTVVSYVGSGKWRCLCECGNETITKSADLKTGNSKSCGCLQREAARILCENRRNPNNTDATRQCSTCRVVKDVGEFYTAGEGLLEYVCKSCKREKRLEDRVYNPKKYMLKAAKARSKLQNVPFSITERDISIPEFCPLLEIKLESNIAGDGIPTGNSPSLDKIIPSLGYVPGNIVVISHRANSLKGNASIEELERLVANLKIICSKRS